METNKIQYDCFGLPIVRLPVPQKIRSRKFVIDWEIGDQTGKFACFACDEEDARMIFRNAPGYFGYSIVSVEEV